MWLLTLLLTKKLNQIVTEIFIRRRKINISTVFIRHSYFPVPKGVRLNSTHYFYYENSKQPITLTNRI